MAKSVLITGAARGIGYAAARLFAAAGYIVYANYYTTEAPLRQLVNDCQKLGQTVIPIRADITVKSQVAAMLAATPGVDVLVNNAGIAQTKEFTALSEADWDNMLAVNLKGAFLCAQAALPYMLRQKNGSIVNISSVWGVTGGACEVHYSAAKAGLIGLTKALAKELGPSGIRVNCLAPGLVDTDMNKDLTKEERRDFLAQTALGLSGRPRDIAQAALFLAESAFITGEVLNINGGFHI